VTDPDRTVDKDDGVWLVCDIDLFRDRHSRRGDGDGVGAKVVELAGVGAAASPPLPQADDTVSATDARISRALTSRHTEPGLP
jgi:hypothetical protein